MLTHILAPAHWGSRKHMMEWCQGWRRTARHKPADQCGEPNTVTSGWLTAHRCDIIRRLYWPLISGHETDRLLSYKKRDESSSFVLLYHLFQRLSPHSEFLVSGNLLHYHSSNQSSTFHRGMRLQDQQQKHNISVVPGYLSERKKVMHQKSAVPDRLYFTADKDPHMRQTQLAGHVNAVKVRMALRLITNQITWSV